MILALETLNPTRCCQLDSTFSRFNDIAFKITVQLALKVRIDTRMSASYPVIHRSTRLFSLELRRGHASTPYLGKLTISEKARCSDSSTDYSARE